MGHRLPRNHQMTLGLFPLVKPLHYRTETDSKLGRFHIGSLETWVAIVDVALPLTLTITDFRAPYTPAVRGVMPHAREAANLARFQHNRLRQDRSDTIDRLQPLDTY
jgi:hypothetical protein